MSGEISSPSSGLTLPTELLWEMAKCMGFDGHRQCCLTNFQLNALTHSAALKTKQKLEDYNLGDVRLLAAWFQCWMAKDRGIRTRLLLQCYLFKEAKKRARTQNIHGNQLLITLESLMEEFCENLDQLRYKMGKVIKSELNLSSGLPDCRMRFSKRRRNLVKKTFEAPKAQLQHWLYFAELCEADMFDDIDCFQGFYQELALCRQGMYRCKQRALHCQKLMTRCADALLFPRCI